MLLENPIERIKDYRFEILMMNTNLQRLDKQDFAPEDVEEAKQIIKRREEIAARKAKKAEAKRKKKEARMKKHDN